VLSPFRAAEPRNTGGSTSTLSHEPCGMRCKALRPGAAHMSVLAVPPSESDMSMVSLWLRYGMCGCSVASALITSPSALSDLLIACASFSCSPVEPDFFTLRGAGAGIGLVPYPT
jgi:hypothetical protein